MKGNNLIQTHTHTHTFIPISVFKSFHITGFHTNTHLALVSCHSFVHEEVCMKQKAKIKNDKPIRIKVFTQQNVSSQWELNQKF